MRKGCINIFAIIALLVVTQSIAASDPDTGEEKKIYHNEKWDIMLLYPDDWSYKEGYRENVPVVMYPPKDEEPDGFIMVYFLGEKVFEDLEEFKKHFEEVYLSTYEGHEIVARLLSETKEGYKAFDYRYTFVDEDEAKYVSDSRLTITEGKACWMISFDRPSDRSEAVDKEAIEIIESIIFSPAEYLTQDEQPEESET